MLRRRNRIGRGNVFGADEQSEQSCGCNHQDHRGDKRHEPNLTSSLIEFRKVLFNVVVITVKNGGVDLGGRRFSVAVSKVKLSRVGASSGEWPSAPLSFPVPGLARLR